MASLASKKPMIEVEDRQGRTVSVTLVRFLVDEISDLDHIEAIGGQLYSLVEDLHRNQILIDLSTVEIVASYFLGKLIGLRKRLKSPPDRLALVVKPGSLVDEAFVVCGFRAIFEIYPSVDEALEHF